MRQVTSHPVCRYEMASALVHFTLFNDQDGIFCTCIHKPVSHGQPVPLNLLLLRGAALQPLTAVYNNQSVAYQTPDAPTLPAVRQQAAATPQLHASQSHKQSRVRGGGTFGSAPPRLAWQQHRQQQLHNLGMDDGALHQVTPL